MLSEVKEEERKESVGVGGCEREKSNLEFIIVVVDCV